LHTEAQSYEVDQGTGITARNYVPLHFVNIFNKGL